MSATILPFPLVCRRDFVPRNAARIAEPAPRTADKLLGYVVQVQVDTMVRRGIAPDLIEREAKSFENAIRGDLCRLMRLGGDTS